MDTKRRNHNEGSIRERKDGRFEVRVTAGIDFETGKSKRISYYTKTKSEAIKKLHEEEYRIHFQEHVDPTSTRLVDWLRMWLDTYMKNSLKQSTYTSYKGYIEKHIATAFPYLKLKDLSSKLLQDFYNYKLTQEGLSPKTIANLHRCLHKAIPLMQVILNELLQWKNVQLADSRTAGALYTDSGFIVTNQTGGYIEPRTFKDYYDEMLQAAGLGHYTFHALRHTFATRALEQGMNAKTLSTLLGHYSVSFTLDTYTHVLDSQKHEEMQLMEELFAMPASPQQQSYPVIVTPCSNGFIFNPVDFEALSIEADNIQYGISCIQSAICQRIAGSYPPPPTPVDELVVNGGEFVVVVNV